MVGTVRPSEQCRDTARTSCSGRICAKRRAGGGDDFRDKDFDRDCFQIGPLTFVSEKLRRAMALGPADIQYFDVDAAGFPLPCSKHYQLMHVPVTEDVSDPEHSDYSFRQRPDGLELLSPPHAIAFRRGAEPAHQIFCDRFFKVILCTDELALRVLWAGCTGLRFVDPARLRDGLGPYRTLRGVEEDDVWDPVRRSYRQSNSGIP